MRRTRTPSTPKALEKELKSDSWMMLSFGVAKELGMTVQQLHANITPEELVGWSAYFSIINKEQQAAMEKARQRR
jgi:hypothetical protein